MLQLIFKRCLGFIFLLLSGISNVSACDIIFGTGFSVNDIKLVHQWRFNEVGGSVLKDEACGSNAYIIDVGNSNAAVLNGSVVLAGGDKNTADYVRLPDDIFEGLTSATIEIWASNLSTQAWSRIFDFGPSTNDFLMMSWNRFTDPNSDRIQWASPFTISTIEDDTVGNYGLNTQKHIVMLIKYRKDLGITEFYWYVDGIFKDITAISTTLADLGKSNNFLGRSKFPDPTANVQYDEVNIYSGLMSTQTIEQRNIQGPNNNVAVTAATYYPGNGRFYIFSGTEYYRQGNYVNPGYPRSISTFWDGWPPGWGIGDLDAITYNPVNGKYLLFRNDELVYHSHAQPPDVGPQSIIGSWVGWPAGWGTGELDAIAYHPPTNKYYLFRGSEFVRQSPFTDPDAGYPKPIAGNWSGWPSEWGSGGIDAVIYDPDTAKFHLFKGDEYVTHSHEQGPDPDFPRPTEGAWFVELPRINAETNVAND
jgi:hypothetical protein